MALSEGDKTLIEKYLDADLSDQESEAFEQKMTDSKEFAEEVKLSTGVLNAIASHQKQALRTELRNMYDEAKQEGTILKNTRAKYWPWIAAASILLILTVLYFIQPGSINHEQIYTSYYKAYPASPNTRSVQVEKYDVAMEAYRKEDYETALAGFQALGEGADFDAKTYIFIGNCELNLGQGSEAVKTFEKVINEGSQLEKQYAYWYLALAHLKSGDVSKTKETLNNIIQQEMIYQPEAEKLLTEFD
ncbi:MAG: hypothetical protein AAFX87_23645 [Bacteroidota bacterium]